MISKNWTHYYWKYAKTQFYWYCVKQKTKIKKEITKKQNVCNNPIIFITDRNDFKKTVLKIDFWNYFFIIIKNNYYISSQSFLHLCYRKNIFKKETFMVCNTFIYNNIQKHIHKYSSHQEKTVFINCEDLTSNSNYFLSKTHSRNLRITSENILKIASIWKWDDILSKSKISQTVVSIHSVLEQESYLK